MKKLLYSYSSLLGIDILGNTHIIGAGLSGLSASIHSLNKNKVVNLYESSNVAGGRCRSFYEKKLNIEIDNGNHLVFSANTNFYELCKIVNSIDKIKTLPPELAFYDLINNTHWNLGFKEIKMLNLLLGSFRWAAPGTQPRETIWHPPTWKRVAHGTRGSSLIRQAQRLRQ